MTESARGEANRMRTASRARLVLGFPCAGPTCFCRQHDLSVAALGLGDVSFKAPLPFVAVCRSS